MAKLDYFLHKNLNPADELRELLTKLEDRQLNLKSFDPTKTLFLFRDLDQLYSFISDLESSELNLVSEHARFDALQSYFRKQAPTILKRLGGPAALAEHRPRPAPDHARWWWYIHEVVAERQQRQLKSFLVNGAGFLLIVAVIITLFRTVLAPSPEAVARAEAENDAFLAFDQADNELALKIIQEGLEKVPGDPNLLILDGVFRELVDEQALAAKSYELAQINLNDPLIFYLGRGRLYLRTAQLVKAEDDARAAIALNEEYSAAWLLLGQSLEFQGRQFEAIPVYQQAGDLGLANGESEVVVFARMALSRVGIGP